MPTCQKSSYIQHSWFSTIWSQRNWPADLLEKFSLVEGYWHVFSMTGKPQSDVLRTLAAYNENKFIAPSWTSLTHLPAHSAERVNLGSSAYACCTISPRCLPLVLKLTNKVGITNLCIHTPSSLHSSKINKTLPLGIFYMRRKTAEKGCFTC